MFLTLPIRGRNGKVHVRVDSVDAVTPNEDYGAGNCIIYTAGRNNYSITMSVEDVISKITRGANVLEHFEKIEPLLVAIEFWSNEKAAEGETDPKPTKAIAKMVREVRELVDGPNSEPISADPTPEAVAPVLSARDLAGYETIERMISFWDAFLELYAEDPSRYIRVESDYGREYLKRNFCDRAAWLNDVRDNLPSQIVDQFDFNTVIAKEIVKALNWEQNSLDRLFPTRGTVITRVRSQFLSDNRIAA